jgi:hypothetical protein
MKRTINLSEFRNEFARSERRDSFTYEGLEALFNYLDDLDNDYEFDLIEICCDYSEYQHLEELQKDHQVDSIEELEANTSVIRIGTESFIIANY